MRDIVRSGLAAPYEMRLAFAGFAQILWDEMKAHDSVLFAVLPGMEFAPLAAAETGGDVAAAQAALRKWFIPTLGTSSVIFAIGIYLFARGIVRSGILRRSWTWLVVGGLALVAIARFVPLGVVQFYVQGVAGIFALWPVAYMMWKEPEAPPRGLAQPTETAM